MQIHHRPSGRHVRIERGNPWRAVAARWSAVRQEPERGDVPGWVMITLMSAVLVAGLLAVAAPALEGLFESALNQVQQP